MKFKNYLVFAAVSTVLAAGVFNYQDTGRLVSPISGVDGKDGVDVLPVKHLQNSSVDHYFASA